MKPKSLGWYKVLRKEASCGKMITRDYPSSYADLRYRPGVLISNTEILAQRLGEQGQSEVAQDVKKPEPKLKKPYKNPGSAYRALRSFKPFDDGLDMKLLEVLTMNPV